MDMKELFVKYMGDVTNVALATDADGKANVRAVSIGYDETTPNTVYFVTFAGSNKAGELKTNPNVTFIPFPDKPNADVTIRVRGTAAPAEISVERIAELIGKHLPEFGAQIPAMGENGALFQVQFENAEVSLGMNPPEIITF